MYRSILVPLDGSPFAEQAIAAALTVAEVSHAKVTLMRAWDPANYRYSSELTPPFLELGGRDKLAAMQYLDSLAAKVRPGTTVPGGNARFILLRVERPRMVPRHPYIHAVSAWRMDDDANEEVVTQAYDYLDHIARSLKARRPEATVDVDVRFAERPGVATVEAQTAAGKSR